MKIKTFNYLDLKGKQSVRTALVIQEPCEKIMAVDISELSEEDQVDFANQYKALRETFLSQVKALENSFELYYRLRQFFPDQMDISEELEV